MFFLSRQKSHLKSPLSILVLLNSLVNKHSHHCRGSFIRSVISSYLSHYLVSFRQSLPLEGGKGNANEKITFKTRKDIKMILNNSEGEELEREANVLKIHSRHVER